MMCRPAMPSEGTKGIKCGPGLPWGCPEWGERNVSFLTLFYPWLLGNEFCAYLNCKSKFELF